MLINRREFLILTVGFAAGCSATGNGRSPASNERIVNAGTISKYRSDGVYSSFRDQGFFVIRQGERLFALSSICTHRRCKLDVEKDRSFYCHCHGSTFAPDGHVTEGPARRDLPMLPTTEDGGQLLVTVPGLLPG